MNYVDPIKDVKIINKIKRLMLKHEKIKEYALFVVGINSGLRISDILLLKWDDVLDDSDNITDKLRIKEKKTGKTKVFPLNTAAKEALNKLKKQLKNIEYDEHIFKSNSNRTKSKASPWRRQYVWDFLQTYAQLAGFTGNIGTHTLRKTFGYHAYTNGVSLELIQKIFNHSSPGITLRYIGITQQEIDDVYLNIINL
ncbi:site-specific integrase [Tepiditoga spiralis]|uniref:Site-specific integrase n=1 Tax=Tepiditoga spiralis TaxID=2108365 RepID=A0A7G1G7S6_9BACT|nr:tyrosine-type recombinase/integrase [Tepiditoga spiralis]BBE31436.1 site-specific integrase [Tepiditoga spiralis]